MLCHTKRKTWCGLLVDFRSQIRYSSASSALDYGGSGTDGKSHITDQNGNPKVFNLERNDDGLYLNDYWAKPDDEWNADNELMFSVRKYFFSVRLKRTVFLFWSVYFIFPATKHSANFI